MFNFLTSLSSTIYLYIIAALLAMTVLFGGLLYREIGKTSVAESALDSVVQTNSDLQNLIQTQEKSCELTDKLLAQYQTDKSFEEETKNDKLSSLDKIPSSTTVKSNESNVVNIDGKLPSELIRLLGEDSVQDTGSKPVHP